MTKPLTYVSYLKIDELLGLQHPVSDGPEHDEQLFIIIHQVYELWFKEVLHETEYLMGRLEQNETPLAGHTFKRILTILKVMVAQIDVLETMTPINFLSFRERLESGSGFQSYQFRELEFALGHKRRTAVDHYPEDSTGRNRLEKRYAAPTLWDAFLAYLAANGYDVGAALTRDVTQPVTPDEQVQKVLIDVYRSNHTVAGICERMIDFDEGLQEWRYRHVQMVRRTIGNKRGTGGSTGADYLASTLFHPVFPDLWEIRTSL
jgi:tryptophan 2,3-dioxygenase